MQKKVIKKPVSRQRLWQIKNRAKYNAWKRAWRKNNRPIVNRWKKKYYDKLKLENSGEPKNVGSATVVGSATKKNENRKMENMGKVFSKRVRKK